MNPLAPLGCALQFHNKPGKQNSWGEHASDRFYIIGAIACGSRRYVQSKSQTLYSSNMNTSRSPLSLMPMPLSKHTKISCRQYKAYAIQQDQRTWKPSSECKISTHLLDHSSHLPVLPTYKRIPDTHPRVESVQRPRVEPNHTIPYPRVHLNPITDIVEFQPATDAPQVIASSPKMQQNTSTPNWKMTP
jgi:hypothetical protein